MKSALTTSRVELQTRKPSGEFRRHWTALIAVCALAIVSGCAPTVLPVDRVHTTVLVATPAAALGAIAAKAGTRNGLSGLRMLPEAAFALEARLELARRAEVSLDLQYYLVSNDETGHVLLHELRRSALRGVRVRLLLDDLYSAGIEPLLLGLASMPNVEVRLFNPVLYGRTNALLRLANIATDFRRLNHRMHNKLFLADGSVAVVGGRNIANEYFMRNPSENYVDFDALAVGPVVSQLAQSFDTYWNSEQAFPVESLARSKATPAELRSAFDRAVPVDTASPLTAAVDGDRYGNPPLAADLDAGLPQLVWARAEAYADTPEKVERHGDKLADLVGTVIYKVVQTLQAAENDILLISPYFIPGKLGLELLRKVRDKGVSVRVFTNSFASGDVPLASLAYERYRLRMLRMGIELYEFSSPQRMRSAGIRALFGTSKGRLHSKLAIVDQQTVLMGSMNLDSRSAWTNTELGLTIRSPELAQLLLKGHSDNVPGRFNQVRLARSDGTLEWVVSSADGPSTTLYAEPEGDWLTRFRFRVLSAFVPESVL